MHVGVFSSDAPPGIDGYHRSVEPAPAGPVAPGVDGIARHVPGHGLQGIASPVDHQIGPGLGLARGAAHPSRLLDAHGRGPVADGGVGVDSRSQKLGQMQPHFHGLAGGLAAYENQRPLGLRQDLSRFLYGLIPACGLQSALLPDKGLPDPVAADDLLKLGIAHLAGILYGDAVPG
ncbi:MAG: hypothetical protein BWY13_00223 [Euryarchaeota archaeon ADurb.Bin190]|nr:MAG: hypothetical protein BWY13_00223 [Euryarchaeota archaeon ADurb.Bin190]